MSEAKTRDTEPGPGCPWTESVAAYILGELSAQEIARLEEHLRGCDACRREVAELREVIGRMRELAPEILARDLAPEILAKIEESEHRESQPSPRGWRILTLPRIAAVAASFLVALAAGWMLSRRSAPRPADRLRPEVRRALDWLAASQEPGGSWDAGRWGGQDTFTVGLSGLAVLSFLGAGETHLSTSIKGPRARTVERGVGYLLSQQGAKGRFGPFFGAALYNHGIATVALLETYARTRDAGLRRPIGRALELIRREQSDSGGWGYLGDAGPPNTSVTAWQLHALLLAVPLGWPEAEAAARRGLAWLEGVVGSDGLAGYRRPGDHPNGPETLTAMTALFLSVGSGLRRAEAATAAQTGGVEAAEGGVARRQAVRSDFGELSRAVVRFGSRATRDTDYYRSYFLTHALRVAARSVGPSPDEAASARESGSFGRPDDAAGPGPPDGTPPGGSADFGKLGSAACGELTIDSRAAELRAELLERQLKAGPNSGSWSPSDRWGLTGGRVYATAMAALSLEADRRADELVAWVRGVAR